MRTFKFIRMALSAIVMCVNFTFCSDNGEDSSIHTQSAIEEFTQSDMNFTEKANEQTLTFTTNADWTISVAPTNGGEAWCTASPTKGSAGNQIVKIAVTENSTYDDRSVTITLRAGNESKSLVVTQKQKDAILLTSDKFEIEQKGGTFTVEVKANVNYTTTIGETCKDWITEGSNTRALSTTTKTYSVATNEDSEKREGTITFTDGTLSETVHIYQAGVRPTFITINVPTAGDLPKITERRDFKALKLTGYLNGTDIKVIRSMPLEYLDISEVHIVAGGDPYYPTTYKTKDNEIGVYMFYSCSHLKQILLPNSVTKIDDRAFRYCTSLTNIDIPNSVTTIGSDAFGGCKSLTSIDIPNRVTKIGSNAFGGCASLTSIDIPNGVTTIERYTFEDCTSLTSIDIPNSVTTIEERAFEYCKSLTIVKIGTGLESIQGTCLLDFGSIKEVYCFATTPPESSESGFDGIVKSEAKLYVPKGTYQTYYMSNWGAAFTNIIEMEK